MTTVHCVPAPPICWIGWHRARFAPIGLVVEWPT